MSSLPATTSSKRPRCAGSGPGSRSRPAGRDYSSACTAISPGSPAPGPAFLSAFFGHRLTDVEAPDYSHAIRWRNTSRTQRFFSEQLVGEIAAARKTEDREVDYPGAFGFMGPSGAEPVPGGGHLPPFVLLSSQGDRMMMAHSVEGRFPFLDHRVVEFCNRLPARFKLRGLQDKYLLRKLSQEWLPRRRCPTSPSGPIGRPFIGAFLAAPHLTMSGNCSSRAR